MDYRFGFLEERFRYRVLSFFAGLRNRPIRVFSILFAIVGWQLFDDLPRACAQQIGLSETASRSAPIVGGFDRFGRHDEISDVLSGMLLISELNCTACHATKQKRLQPKSGPSLTGVGLRLRREWLIQYLADPRSTKPGTTMPDVIASVADSQRASVVNALAAFLATQQRPFPEVKAGGATPVIHQFWNHGDEARGAKLYHSIGCVACHAPDEAYETVETKPSAVDDLLETLDPEEIEELGLASLARRVESIPHSDLPNKYSARSLTMFLLDPHSIRPSARMPSLRLSPAEAADIAAYLLQGDRSQRELLPSASSADLIQRGKHFSSSFSVLPATKHRM